MKFRSFGIIVLISMTVLTLSAADERISEWVQKGDEAFTMALHEGSDFSGPIFSYTKAISGLHAPPPSLIYNLGNSLYLDGLYVEALIAYTRALHLEPGRSDIQENRNAVLEKLEIKPENRPLPEYIFWSLPILIGLYGTWTVAVIIPVFLCIWALIMKLRKKNLPYFLFLVISGFCLLVVISNLTWEKHENSTAFLYSKNAELRKGDSSLFETIGEYPQGTEVIILLTDHLWSKVRISGTSQIGWIRRDDLMTFDDLVDKFR